MSRLDKNLYAIQCMYLEGCVFLYTMKKSMNGGHYDIAEHQSLYMAKLFELGFGEYPNVMRLMDFMDMFTKLVAEGVTVDVIVENKLNKQVKGFGDWIDDDLVKKLSYEDLVKLRTQVCRDVDMLASGSARISSQFPYASVISAEGVKRMSDWNVDTVPSCTKEEIQKLNNA